MRIEPIQIGAVQSEASPEAAHPRKEKRAAAEPAPASDSPHPVPVPAASVPHHEEEIQTKVDGQRIIYRFVDKQTGEVIFQVPSEQMLNVMRGIEEQLHPKASSKKVNENF
jgi:hypothetical protein